MDLSVPEWLASPENIASMLEKGERVAYSQYDQSYLTCLATRHFNFNNLIGHYPSVHFKWKIPLGWKNCVLSLEEFQKNIGKHGEPVGGKKISLLSHVTCLLAAATVPPNRTQY